MSNNGWIEWKGGKMPVERGTLVDLKFRDDDEIYFGKNAICYQW